MADTRAIKIAQQRNAKAVTLRPSVGQGTSITRATIIDGLQCEIADGAWRLTSDLPESEGGDNRGPSPGVLGRAALASCVAMGIVLRAAEEGIPLHAVSVEVQADWDARGYLGLSEQVPPGYTTIRVVVDVQSPAPAERIREIVAHAERYSPYIDVYRRANDVVVDLRIGRGATA
jgi:uncharacterized OsmC-like protein